MGLVLTWPVGRAASEHGGASVAPATGPVFAYLAGTVAGGAAFGLVLGLIGGVATGSGDVARAVALALLALCVGVAVALEWRADGRAFAQRSIQVPRRWLLWRCRSCAAVAFGAMIGSGALTRLKHPSAYALGAVALLAPSAVVAGVVGATYGACRGLVLVVTWLADRRGARRPAWPALTMASRTLCRTLALTGGVSFLIAATLYSTS